MTRVYDVYWCISIFWNTEGYDQSHIKKGGSADWCENLLVKSSATKWRAIGWPHLNIHHRQLDLRRQHGSHCRTIAPPWWLYVVICVAVWALPPNCDIMQKRVPGEEHQSPNDLNTFACFCLSCWGNSEAGKTQLDPDGINFRLPKLSSETGESCTCFPGLPKLCPCS